MVLGEVVAVNAAAIVGFDELEPIGIKLPERHAGVVHVVEHTEFHRDPPAPSRRGRVRSRPGWRPSRAAIRLKTDMAGTSPAMAGSRIIAVRYRHSTFLTS